MDTPHVGFPTRRFRAISLHQLEPRHRLRHGAHEMATVTFRLPIPGPAGRLAVLGPIVPKKLSMIENVQGFDPLTRA